MYLPTVIYFYKTYYYTNIDIPILPMLSAKVTFQAFEFRDDIDSELFEVPSNYIEDPARFPDL